MVRDDISLALKIISAVFISLALATLALISVLSSVPFRFGSFSVQERDRERENEIKRNINQTKLN